MTRITLWVLGACIAFYGLLADMAYHLPGWRAAEPFAFIVVFVICTALAKVIFDDAPKFEEPKPSATQRESDFWDISTQNIDADIAQMVDKEFWNLMDRPSEEAEGVEYRFLGVTGEER